MAKIFLHYTCCLIMLTICVDQGDGVGKMRAEEIKSVARQADLVKKRHIGAEFMKRKERMDDIVREVDLLKGMAEMVDHHIDDFYEEFPRERNKEHPPRTRHFSHKSSHDWLSTESRPETAERRPKTTKRRSKSAKKALKDRFHSIYNDTMYDKQKSALREQIDSDNDFWLHKKTKTKKAAESRNKHHAHNHGRQYLHTLSDSEYDDDVENRKYSKATEMKITAESMYIYNATSKKYDDDDVSLHKNIRSKTTPDSPTKNHESKEKYEEDFSFHKKSKSTEIDSREFPNIYYEDSKKLEDDDYHFHKNIKTIEKATSESPNKYYESNTNFEDDDFDVHKSNKATDKTKYEFPNKYKANIEKIEDDDFHGHKNDNTTVKTTFGYLKNYHGNKQNHEGDDYNLHKNTKTSRKITSELLNKHRAYNKKIEDDGLNFHKNVETTDKRTSEFLHKYYTYKQKYEDDNLNKNSRTKSTSASLKKYHAIKQKYEDDNFDSQESTKNTEKTKSESPNKYYANSKKYKDEDFNFHKNIKTTDETTPEILNENRANKRNRKDDFNFYKNTKTTDKTTSESPNKYHAHEQKYYEHNDFDFHKNKETAEKTITESPNKYHTKKHNYDSKSFEKSSNSEDALDDIKYTTNREMRTVPKNAHYSKKIERAEKHFPKLSEIEMDPGDYGTSTTETRTSTEFRKGYNLREHENTKPHKLLNFVSEKSFQPTESTRTTIPIPLEKYYLKVDQIYRKYIQESSNSNDDVIKSAKFIDATEIKTTAETQSSQTRPFVGRASVLEEDNPTVYKHNDKVHFTEPRSSSDDLRNEISQETGTGSTNTVPETLTDDNCEIPTEISENDVEAHKLQTEDKLETENKLETKWTWPTFEHMLEEIGKKYDWRNDRWIELKHHANNKMTKADFINNFQEKHKFSYSTIKLNSTKSRRNVVIAVTAVR